MSTDTTYATSDETTDATSYDTAYDTAYDTTYATDDTGTSVPLAGGPVEVTYPSGPTNAKQSGPLRINTTYNDSGSIFLTNDLVTFEIENDRGDAVTCTFELDDDQQPGVVLAWAALTWAAGDTSTQYIQFQNFPLRADQVTPMDTCSYVVSLTNDADPGSGTEVWENIY